MTASQLHALIGDSISFTYKVNGVPYSGTFTYDGNIDFATYNSVLSFNVSDNPVFGTNLLTQYEACFYYFRTSYTDQTYFTDIDIQLNFDYFGGARGGFMLGQSWSISGIQSAGNSVAVGGNYCGNFPIITGNTQADSSLANYYGVVNTTWNNVNYRPLYYDSTNFSIHHVHYNSIATRSLPNIGNSSSSYRYLLLYVVAPYTYGNFDVSVTDPAVTTTTTTSASSGDVNVTVNIDNSETNSILSDIWDAITDLVSGIAHLFIPDYDYIENWLEDMGDVISDAFTDKVNISVLKDLLLDLGTYGNTSSLEFPALTIGDSTIRARAVELKPSGFDELFDFVETAINIVCTIWVFNMVLLRVKAVFVGEQVIEVEGDVE